MALKTQRIYYNSRNQTTGLSDVRATIYRNNVQVATNIALAELNASVAPGLYFLEIPTATLVTYGGAGVYTIVIDSVTKPAQATAKAVVTVNDEDDLELHLSNIETKVDTANASLGVISSEIAAVKSTVQNTNSVVTDVNYGNANLKTLIESVISAVQSVQNNTSFIAAVPSQLNRPDIGTKRYQIMMRVYDTVGHLEDPDLSKIFVAVQNEVGLDRTNLLIGYTSGPVEAVRGSEGIYSCDIEIPYNAALEQLNFNFSYTENGSPLSFVRTTEIIPDAIAAGVALQSTLLDVLADTSDTQPKVSTILNLIQDPTSGLANLKALIDVVDSVVDANNAQLTSSLHGLAQLKAILDTKASQVSVDAIFTALNSDVKGAGFDSGKDSLTKISERTYFGGTAI